MRHLLPLCALAVALAACGGDDTSVVVDSGSDTSTTKDTGTNDTGTNDTGTNDAGKDVGLPDVVVDAGPLPVNGCTVFVNKSAPNDTRAIDFPTGVIAAQYTPNCMRVKAGQSVTWNGAFSNHPLTASGGDAGNPITTTNTGTTKTFAFPAAGTYGFACQFHGGSMFGAIEVVP